MRADEKTDELLNSYLDGELSSRERAEVKRRVANVEGMAQRLEQLRSVRSLLQAFPQATPPDELAENIMAQLERQSLLEETPVTATGGARAPASRPCARRTSR